ncbi:ComEA family DNA-binding protein [Enorma burkinafasonensis]|uniref:ComEA family DNA-binding protein n=1 Tax=Enorma burkinafasonensis TaxID=2590867 RepID=UPI001FE80CEF|nr:ComEA family DNA-binding protein [Enorma burkinafasonensis]
MAQMAQGSRGISGFRRLGLVLRQRPILALVSVLLLGMAIGAFVLGSGTAQGETFAIERAQAGADGSSVAGGAESADEGAAPAPDADGGEGPSGGEREPADDGPLVVDVDGAVASPGVVEVPAGSRVADAIDAAGGLAEDADVSGVNRAAPLADGEKVYIPRAGEASQAPAAAGSPPGEEAALVNINTADLSELDELPGIGPATAQAIIDEREANGPFTSIEDIMRVSGIGEKKFEKLADRICV